MALLTTTIPRPRTRAQSTARWRPPVRSRAIRAPPACRAERGTWGSEGTSRSVTRAPTGGCWPEPSSGAVHAACSQQTPTRGSGAVRIGRARAVHPSTAARRCLKAGSASVAGGLSAADRSSTTSWSSVHRPRARPLGPRRPLPRTGVQAAMLRPAVPRRDVPVDLFRIAVAGTRWARYGERRATHACSVLDQMLRREPPVRLMRPRTRSWPKPVSAFRVPAPEGAAGLAGPRRAAPGPLSAECSGCRAVEHAATLHAPRAHAARRNRLRHNL
jgi:hypothetical protein